MSEAIRPRTEYKAVWNELASTEKSAKLHVIGSEDEKDFANTAIETVSELEASVGVNSTDVILEIGCGVGRVGAALAPRCKEWVGCDVSSGMLGHTARRLKDAKNVRLVEISGFDLKGVDDASIDLVYCTVVFMHLDEWDRYGYVLEAKRVLKPGGRIFIDNFNLCSDGGWNVFETHRTVFRPENRPAHISKSSTPQELETYLRRAGFKNIGLRIDTRPGWVEAFGTK